jgi:hypothetical protein
MRANEFELELSKLDTESKFPEQEGILLNSLYGKLTVPESQYVFAWTPWNPGNERYLVNAHEERKAGDIYMTFKEILERETRELFKKNSYLSELNILIGKRLKLPEGIQLREGREDSEFMRSAIKAIKENGIKLTNETLIDLIMRSGRFKSDEATEILEDVTYEILSRRGYERKEMPRITYKWVRKGKGEARPEMRFFTGENCYLGELKIIQTSSPRWRTFLERF